MPSGALSARSIASDRRSRSVWPADDEFEAREKQRALNRVTRVVREQGFAIGLFSFLFQQPQQASFKALVASSCLMCSRDEFQVISSEFPRDVYALRKKTHSIYTDINGEDSTINIPISANTAEISEKKQSQLKSVFQATIASDEALLRMLLNPQSVENTVQVDDINSNKQTPLHVAAGKGVHGAVAVLLELGASTAVRDIDGRTPLSTAIERKHYNIARQLRAAGANLGWDEFTVAGELCEAVKANNLEYLELILGCGASIDSADYDK